MSRKTVCTTSSASPGSRTIRSATSKTRWWYRSKRTVIASWQPAATLSISSSSESLKRSLDCSPNGLVRLISSDQANFFGDATALHRFPPHITQLQDFAAEFIFVRLGQFPPLRGHTVKWAIGSLHPYEVLKSCVG